LNGVKTKKNEINIENQEIALNIMNII